MKKTILTLTAILIASLSFAQGGGFNYKALITDNGNALASQSVTIKFTVLQNGTTAIFQETHTATTDANGIVAVNIGEGTVVSGDFDTIDWGGNPNFLKVEIDTGSGYQNFGTTEFKAVPYAKYAENAGNVFSGNFGDLSNVPSGLSDGDNDTHLTEAQVDAYVSNNGYLTQVDNIQGIPVSSTTPANGQVLKYNGSQFVPADDDTSSGSGADGVVNAATFSGTTTKTLTLSRSNGLGNITADFTDNDTHLTDAQIAAMGYIKDANDADHDPANELQTINKSGNTITLSNGGGSVTDSDTHLTDAQISAMGYIKNANDADHDTTNEIQNLSITNNQLTISQGNTVTLPSGGATKLDDLSDARSDNDGTNNGSSIFIGVDAGANDDQSNNRNVGVGYQALNANTDGSYNTATGFMALHDNTTGDENTAFGNKGLEMNTTGSYNTATGSNALQHNTTGDGNTANGAYTLQSNTTGYNNTATGLQSLYANTTGNGNTANGAFTLQSNTTGHNNTATGSEALMSNTTGSGNTASGRSALIENETGIDNTAIGHGALYHNVSGHYNTAVGDEALYMNTSGRNNVGIGEYALHYSTTGRNNTSVGAYAAYQSRTAHSNVAIGTKALANNEYVSNLVAVGDSTLLHNGMGAGSGEAIENTAVGSKALYSNTTGYKNTAHGFEALFSNTEGFKNTAIGRWALYSNIGGDYNTAAGERALLSNTYGGNNSAYGTGALSNNTWGNNNTAVGEIALLENTSGDENTAIGAQSMRFNTTGEDNTAGGYLALYNNTTGNHNTAFGAWAFYSGNNYSNSTAIGYGAEISSSNEVRLGNSSVSTIGGYANWSTYSDRRFKTDIQENVVGLAFIKKLRPVTYHMDMDAVAKFNKTPDSLRLPESERLKAAEVQSGFIAQEVEQAAQSVGYDFHGVDKPDNENDHYGLRYAEFVVPLTKAVQELNQKHEEEVKALETTIQNQQKKIENQAKQLQEQKAKLQEQEKRLQALEKILLKKK